MTVFKAFVKVLNACKIPAILYTVILIVFAVFSMKTGGTTGNFTQSKPDVLIVDYDGSMLSEGFIEYMRGVCVLTERSAADFDEGKAARPDGGVPEADREAVFYREQNYIIYIPAGFEAAFLAYGSAQNGSVNEAPNETLNETLNESGESSENLTKPQLEILSTGDYYASYTEMLVDRYISTASLYADMTAAAATGEAPGSAADSTTDGAASNAVDSGGEERCAYIVSKTAETLAAEADVHTISLLDTTKLENAAVYYNFATYSLLAGCVYVICLILSSFRDGKILKRTAVSCMKPGRFNIQLLLSNALFAVILWLLYIAMSIVIVGADVMLTFRGTLFIMNSFMFALCALTISFLIGNLVTNKNAIGGIVNVIALGTSFLCGAFVPVQFLPGAVLKAAHIFPAYWYIQNNEYLKSAETLEAAPYITNIAVMAGFCVLFAAGAVYASRLKRRK